MSQSPSTPRLDAKVTLLGCGKMGIALLRGWLVAGIDAASVQVVEPHPSDELASLVRSSGTRIVELEAAEAADVVLAAVKPQSAPEVAKRCGALFRSEGTVVSIMAGITLGRLRSLFPSAAFAIRTMPNLAAMAGASATAMVAGPDVPERRRSLAEALMRSVGSVHWLPEEAMVDAACGVSGSGPAYAFHLVECLTAAGIAEGLPAEVAASLARGTLVGAGAVLAAVGTSPEDLRRQVTSPGGTTQAGLAVLMEGDALGDLVRRTVDAATRRSRELGT